MPSQNKGVINLKEALKDSVPVFLAYATDFILVGMTSCVYGLLINKNKDVEGIICELALDSIYNIIRIIDYVVLNHDCMHIAQCHVILQAIM